LQAANAGLEVYSMAKKAAKTTSDMDQQAQDMKDNSSKIIKNRVVTNSETTSGIVGNDMVSAQISLASEDSEFAKQEAIQNNLSIVDMSACINTLKEFYKIPEDDDLIIVKKDIAASLANSSDTVAKSPGQAARAIGEKLSETTTESSSQAATPTETSNSASSSKDTTQSTSKDTTGTTQSTSKDNTQSASKTTTGTSQSASKDTAPSTSKDTTPSTSKDTTGTSQSTSQKTNSTPSQTSKLVNIDVYTKNDRTKLDLAPCEDQKISFKIPVKTTTTDENGDEKSLNLERYFDLKKDGIDIFDKNDPAFNSRCYNYTMNDYDTTLAMRRNLLYSNTTIQCSTGCDYKGLDENSYAECSCAGGSTNVQNSIVDIAFDTLSTFNIGIAKCSDRLFDVSSPLIFRALSIGIQEYTI
jgi:hypothetical protein